VLTCATKNDDDDDDNDGDRNDVFSLEFTANPLHVIMRATALNEN